MFDSKYSKVLTIILIVVIVAIIALLGFLAFDYIRKYTITKQASDFVEDYQGDITTEQNTVDNEVDTNVTLENVIETPTVSGSSTSGKKKKKKWNNYTVVGTMKIPAIKLEYPIVEEVSGPALTKALVALYPSGDNLNQPGNTVVIGHNYRNGTFFSNLKKLSNGAKIYVTDFRGNSITYEVYNKFEASQNDTSFYTRDTNGLAELTLSTCTDASNDQRTIIFARQI